MTDEHATFLKAIIARPDLDLPRLVYADWLEGTAGQKPCPACPELGYGNEPEWTTEIPLYWCGQCDQATRSVPNGHAERAEFIRVQCELARLNDDSVMCHHPDAKPGDWCNDSDCLKCGRAAALRRRERELWAAHGKTWFGTEFTAAGWVTLEDVRRGFMESVEMPWSDFRTHAHAIMAATPLRRVRLTTWPDDALYEPFAAQFPGIEFELPQPEVYTPFA
jgi:uncharacterized protein (TIGR02996 family)